MKKFIFMFAMFMATICASAQNVNGSSKFTDNWDITLQGGIVTPFQDFFKNRSVSPTIVVGATKYVNPWFGLGIEGRTAIGTSDNYNDHTAFDAVNISGIAKLNILNMFKYNNARRTFEPVPYVGIGWGHRTCSDVPSITYVYDHLTPPSGEFGFAMRNYVTFRTGVELNINLGKAKAWGIVVNPSVVWGGLDNMRLQKKSGNFELTAGVRYYFKTSNGTHTFAKMVAPAPIVKEITKEVVRIETVERAAPAVETVIHKKTYIVTFAKNSAEIENPAELNGVNGKVSIIAYASPEGDVLYNKELSARRAANVRDYLERHGVTVTRVDAVGADSNHSNRIAIVTEE